MKKLICALVLLAMLVPVAAMAAVPDAVISLPELAAGTIKGDISFLTDPAIQITTDEYTATYYTSGKLRDYTLKSDESDYVYATFTPDGCVNEYSLRSYPGYGGGILWNYINKYWFDIHNAENPIEELKKDELNPTKLTFHPYTSEELEIEKVDTIPPENLSEILDDYEYNGALDLMKNSIVNVTKKEIYYNNETNSFVVDFGITSELVYDGKPVSVILNGRPITYDTDEKKYIRAYDENYDFKYLHGPENKREAANHNLAVIVDNMITILYAQNRPCSITAIGPAYYNASNETYMTRGAVFKDKENNTKHAFNAEYGLDGKLKTYLVYGKNYNTQTGYDPYNRMVSHEYWDTNFRYWDYSADKDGNFSWWSSAAGGKGESIEDVPTLEVLESLARTEAVAEYSINTSGSEPGLPSIYDNGTALGGGKMKVTNDLIDEYTTLYDIAPEQNSRSSEKIELSNPVKMYLPLPSGMNKSVAENPEIAGDITVVHQIDEQTYEAFNVKSETLDITDKGLLVMATSFSPYEVIWGNKATEAYEKYPAAQVKITGESTVNADLPSTGDNSNLLAYACLLLSSAAALVMLSKRRAHQ